MIGKYKRWIQQESVINTNFIHDYKTNILYQDPEVKKIVETQLETRAKLYDSITSKYNELVRFIQNGDVAVALCLGNTNDVIYPSEEDIQYMDYMVFDILK